MSWIPGISQLKSIVQWASGDSEGARQTQMEFLNQCPVVSQGKSLYHVITGDNEAAVDTQKQFGKAMSGFADGIPVVGHVKGGIHYAVGDKEGGDSAMKAATRTVCVMGGGVAGFLVGGPPGAVAGGIGGGVLMDGVTTTVESAIKDEYCPSGAFVLVEEMALNLKDKPEKIGGNAFDLVLMVVGDGLAGLMSGKIFGKKIQAAREAARALKKANGPDLAANVEAAFDHRNLNAAEKKINYAGQAEVAEGLAKDAQKLKAEFYKNKLLEEGNIAKDHQVHFEKVAKDARIADQAFKKTIGDVGDKARKPIGPNRAHALIGERKGQVAVDVGKKGRLIYEAKGVKANGKLKLKLKQYIADHDYTKNPGFFKIIMVESAKLICGIIYPKMFKKQD